MLQELRNDTRGQSIGIARFFLSLIVAAIVGWIVELVATPVLQGTLDASNNAQANEATNWFLTGVDYLPIAFMIIAFFGLITLSIFQREVLR